jgi:hypothetical protein
MFMGADGMSEMDVLARRFLLETAAALGWEEAGVRRPATRPARMRRPALAALQPQTAGASAAMLSPLFLWQRRPWGEGPRPSRLALQRGRLTRARAEGRHLRIEVYRHDEPVLDARGGLLTLLAGLWPPAALRLRVRLTTWWLTYKAPDGQIGTLHLTLGSALDGAPRYWALDAFAPRFTLVSNGATERDLEDLRARVLARGVGLYRPRA